MTIRAKLVGTFFILTLLGLSSFFVLVYQGASRVAEDTEKSTLRTITRYVSATASAVPGGEELLPSLRTLTETLDGRYALLVLDDKDEPVSYWADHYRDITRIPLEALQAVLHENEMEGHGYATAQHFSWSLHAIPGTPYKLVVLLQQARHGALSTFIDAFALPFLVVAFLTLWGAVWAALIISSLFGRLERQKGVQERLAVALAKARDRALVSSRAKSEFLANISHEIRTPLTAIIGFAESSFGVESSESERVRARETIIRNGRHLLDLINDILDLSKVEAERMDLEKVTVSIVDIVEDVVSMTRPLAKGKNLEFGVNYHFPIPEQITSDPTRLKQILLNLVSNAIKFTETGHVYLDVRYDAEGRKIYFDVEDSGIGLKPEDLENLFQPFTQADSSTSRLYGGTGLGLCLSRQLANLLDGEITVESEHGKGSRFTLVLQVGRDKPALVNELEVRAGYEAPVRQPRRLIGRVLLVEDNPDIQELVMLYLRRTGASVDLADNGERAIELLGEETYDLVCMDMQMPVMDGLTAVRTLREQGYAAPIVMLTANVMEADKERYLAAGCNGIIEKPIDPSGLVGEVARYLAEENPLESSQDPIYSAVTDSDPAFQKIFASFIGGLPTTLDKLKRYADSGDMEGLASHAHQLKGAGGGYGYPQVTTLCGELEVQARQGNRVRADALVRELERVCRRIYAGVDMGQVAGRQG